MMAHRRICRHGSTAGVIVLLVMAVMLQSACRMQDVAIGDTSQRELPSDEAVMRMAYDDSYNVPDNFYIDKRADTIVSYSLYHVKDPSISYELCSNDLVEAFSLESADNTSRSVNGVYVGEYEDERYFEFIRDLTYPDSVGNISSPTSPGFSRVFKCNYVNRDGVDRNLRNGYAGTLNVRPLTAGAVRDYVEYMWQFTFFWPAKKTVLQSVTEEFGNTFRHTLMLALVSNQGFGKCDLIEVVDWVFNVDRATGQIAKEFRPLYSFEADNINGAPQRCVN